MSGVSVGQMKCWSADTKSHSDGNRGLCAGLLKELHYWCRIIKS